jgi:hypothetical protein
MSLPGGVAEWSKATVLKTVGRKPRGFESLLLLKREFTRAAGSVLATEMSPEPAKPPTM